jgi:tetratricopeptide (TPR) repeat protein
MVMNKSRIALTLSVALLALWSVPADAQRARPKRATSQAASKKKLRGKPRPGAQQPVEAAPSDAVQPADAPLSNLAPAAAPPPPAASAPSQSSGSLTSTADRPWAKGISQDQQRAAFALFEAGNNLLKESIFLKAVENYRKALAIWDHPGIHYNLALALLNLDQPIEVHEHLMKALAYGAEPLENEKFEYARNYKTLVEKQLARVEITCDSPGAVVTMDGQKLFVAPGRYTGMVRPGAHSILATREGYVPSDMSRTILPGETTKLDLKLYTDNDLIQYRRRWPAATPWLVVGSGLAMAAGSGWMHMQARDNLGAFDRGIVDCGGCLLTPSLADTLNRGKTLQTAAIGGYALGGAALITGAVLVYLNQPEPYRIDPKDKQLEVVGISPVLSGETRGVQALFRF